MERKIIQIATGSLHQDYVNSHVVYALCNDGTLWEISHNEKWKRLPNIPQDQKQPQVT